MASWKVRAFSLWYGFYFFPTLPERSPMERRALAQSLSRDQCTQGPSSRNNTNTIAVQVLLMHLFHTLYTWYAGIAHHRVLQTSGRGWADSKAVHGMECNGGAHALLEVSLSRGSWPDVYCTASTGRCALPHYRMLDKPTNYQQQQTPGPVPGWYI